MIKHADVDRSKLQRMIRSRKIAFAGNSRLKIYGSLSCTSGKRMLKQHRVFFSSDEEAIQCGYRPCGHCMRSAFKEWKRTIIVNGDQSVTH